MDIWLNCVTQNLNYLRVNNRDLRRESFQGLCDAMDREENLDNVGAKIILPASFQGSPRHYQMLYQDALAIVNKCGRPTLLVTITCNAKWPEIQEELARQPAGTASIDRPDIVSRVFKMKLKAMLTDIINHEVFGRVDGYVWVVEFQKRGLPHCHALLILHSDVVPRTPAEIDALICAEIPDRQAPRVKLPVSCYELTGEMRAHVPVILQRARPAQSLRIHRLHLRTLLAAF